MPYIDAAVVMGRTPPPPPARPMPAAPQIIDTSDDAPVPAVPMPIMTDLEAAGRQLAEASAAVEEARAPLAAAQGHRDRVAGRLGVLDQERQAIIGRRSAGDERDDDAARLALIAADREGLASLLVAAEAAIAEPRAAAERARAALAAAQQAFARAEAAAQEAALVGHAQQLDGLLLATINQIAEVHARIGRGRPSWVPSVELAAAIRKLDLRRKA